ncbi:hypothetical protein WMF26_29660 [Sorangium sp. So ce185]|uniref:hypothetical protein n=1 Tax=Sorangium sp. So ce185 TaxID=3133287 RepID=UPI003F6233DF
MKITGDMAVRGVAIALALEAVACGVEAPLTDSLGTPLGETSAAIVLENQDAELTANLVARVEVQPNELLEFYEPAPGRLIVSGGGRPDGPPRFSGADSRIGIRELWSRATGGQPMTPELQAALKRSEQRRKANRPAAFVAEATETSTVRSARAEQAPDLGDGQPAFAAGLGYCDTTYLASNYADCDWEPGGIWEQTNFDVCKLDWMHGAFAHHNDVYIGHVAVCAADGSISVDVSSDEWSTVHWSMPTDTWHWLYAHDEGCNGDTFDDCASVHLDITDATNDRFHFRFIVNEETRG